MIKAVQSTEFFACFHFLYEFCFSIFENWDNIIGFVLQVIDTWSAK